MSKKYVTTDEIERLASYMLATENNFLSMDQKRGIKKFLKALNLNENRDAKIYTIFACEKLEKSLEEECADYGVSHTSGFFANIKDAISALHENANDMWNGIYNYACIEECIEGLEEIPATIGWYKYDNDKNGYFHIETPDFDKNFCGRTIS